MQHLTQKIKSSSTFEYWTSEGIYQTSAGNDDIIASNIKAGVTLFGTTGTYTDLLFPPVSFSSIATTTTQIDHSWSSVSAATSYLLIVNEDSPVTFIPASLMQEPIMRVTFSGERLFI